MNRVLIIFICVLLYSCNANAQDDVEVSDEETTEDTVSSTLVSDTTLYFSGRTIHADTIENLKRRKEFEYLKNIELKLHEQQNAEAAIRATTEKPTSWLIRLLDTGWIQILLWALGGVIVMVLVYFFINRENIFTRENKVTNVEAVNEDEIEDIADPEAEYRRSVDAGDYRAAVKFLFLILIRSLTDKELIEYGQYKTNHDYYEELPTDLKEEYAALSLIYEYTWYGKQVPDLQRFNSYKTKFEKFINGLRS